MFQSVILAGVHDVKNLRKKIRPDSEHSYNSPWNIAANFTVDLSFSTPEIATMLTDYENDHNTGMDIAAVSERLHYYTSGYPFLVSRLCKYIDELPLEWNTHSVDEAERLILKEDNTLFDDIIKNVLSSHGLAEILRRVLLEGDNVGIMRQDPDINLGLTFGIIVEKNERVVISNIIFETLLTDFFIFQEEKANASRTGGHGGDTEDSLLFIRSGNLDMDAICSRFAAFMRSEYRDEDSGFIERQARLLFLSFLKPIINGVGHYVVEPETRGNRRMDVVVFYDRKEYIVELKIWRGEAYEQAGIEQLAGYLRSRGQRCGWLVSFCDLKRSPRESGTFVVNDLTLRETVVAYRDER
jgi:hypothetical protein